MPQNPFEGGQMDGMMDGLKKQGVMMWVNSPPDI